MKTKNSNQEEINKTSMAGGLVINGLKKITEEDARTLASMKNIHPDIVLDIKSKLPELYANVSPRTLAFNILAIMAGELGVTKAKMEIEQQLQNTFKQNQNLEKHYNEAREKLSSNIKELNYYKNSSQEWQREFYKFKKTGQILAVIAGISVIAVVILTILLCL